MLRCAVLGAVLVTALCAVTPGAAVERSGPAVHVWRISYRSHDGARRAAYVVVPTGWTRADPALPLIISPHGRGLTGLANARLWGALPAVGPFAVVSPDGQGRRLARFSWGYPGQIDDLARMPGIVARALPRIRVDRSRVFAFGGSMGGQEALLLAARHPRLLAGVAVFDGVGDLALQYRNFPQISCGHGCRRSSTAHLGKSLQRLARTEIGGTPLTRPRAYRARSPLDFTRRLASSGVPIQLWWSRADLIVVNQTQQSGRLFRRLRKSNPDAPVEAFVGRWRHSVEMRNGTHLRFALQAFDLVSTAWVPRPAHLHFEPPSDSWPFVQP